MLWKWSISFWQKISYFLLHLLWHTLTDRTPEEIRVWQLKWLWIKLSRTKIIPFVINNFDSMEFHYYIQSCNWHIGNQYEWNVPESKLKIRDNNSVILLVHKNSQLLAFSFFKFPLHCSFSYRKCTYLISLLQEKNGRERKLQFNVTRKNTVFASLSLIFLLYSI